MITIQELITRLSAIQLPSVTGMKVYIATFLFVGIACGAIIDINHQVDSELDAINLFNNYNNDTIISIPGDTVNENVSYTSHYSNQGNADVRLPRSVILIKCYVTLMVGCKISWSYDKWYCIGTFTSVTFFHINRELQLLLTPNWLLLVKIAPIISFFNHIPVSQTELANPFQIRLWCYQRVQSLSISFGHSIIFRC